MPPDPAEAPRSLGDSLRLARTGSSAALGAVLEMYRGYLLAVSNRELPDNLLGKVGASDLVQETFLKAQREFARFSGVSEEELLAWLRCILRNNLTNAVRHYSRTDKRQVAREVPLEGLEAGGRPTVHADDRLTPGSEVAAREQLTALEQALARLPRDYAAAIQLRNYERLPFEEIGRRLGRTSEAARKLWARAVDQLRQGLISDFGE